jgi:hypothetical protein
MKKSIVSVIFLLFAFCASSWAEDFKPIIEETFTEHYRELMCSDNVKALADNLDQRGFDLTDFYVIHMTHKYVPHLSISPNKPRSHSKFKVRWIFHAIMIHDGLVFDMDYTNQIRVVTVSEYFKAMWGENQLNDMLFQIKPADQYGGADLFGTFNQNEFPKVQYVELKKIIEELSS